MPTFAELKSKIKVETRTFDLGGVPIEVRRLNNNHYEELRKRFGVNFLSADAEDYKMRPDVLRAMICMAAKYAIPDITEHDVGELLTSDVLQSPEFAGLLFYIQGQSNEAVDEIIRKRKDATASVQEEIATAGGAA